MEGQIVISFRAAGGPGRGFLERARALELRARAHGAVMVAWDASRITFAFDASQLEHALGLVIKPGDDTAEGELAWSVGIAQGDLKLLAEDSSRGKLAWGPPLVAASVLSQTAEPGEVLCAQTLRALSSGVLLTAGTRMGRDGALRVRGVRLNRTHPWRKQAVEQLSHMRVAPLVGSGHSPPPPASIEAGSLLMLRADPGTGGTRYMTELASRASRALVVVPSGSSFEPLGALRRAIARSVTRELSPLLLELADSLDSLLAGNGTSLDMAARLVTAFLWPKTEGLAPGLLLLDDAKGIDPATLEACVRAARAPSAAFGIVARLDATSGLPSVLAAVPKTEEIEIAPLSRDAAEGLAGGCTNEALDPLARRRWARLAAHVPLGVVESVAYGIVTGELTWKDDKATPRSRASGRGKVRGAQEWILLRARDESEACRAILCVIALLGGEAKVARLAGVLEGAKLRFDVDAVLEELIRGRWLVDTQEDWIALPSRTHRDALIGLVEADARKPLHVAAADVLEAEEGVFGRVEAAFHAGQAGDGPRAARIALAAARGTADARLEASTTQLIAFARRADPSCEETALELLANALERSPSVPPPKSRSIPASRSAPPPPPVTVAAALAPAPALPLARPASVAPPPMPDRKSVAPPARSIPPLAADADVAAAVAGAEAAIAEASAASLPRSPVDDEAAAWEVDTSHDSEPPTIAKIELAPMAPNGGVARVLPEDAAEGDAPRSGTPAVAPVDIESPEPPPASSGANIASRLGELAKEALLSADNAALERWVDGLRAAGESPMFTDRLRALSRLGRGDIGDALRVLRRTRSSLDPNDHKLRCQTSLAMGVALSVAGRPQEALLEGMDALARARHANDERGAEACLAFLAKLFAAQGRPEAERLRAP